MHLLHLPFGESIIYCICILMNTNKSQMKKIKILLHLHNDISPCAFQRLLDFGRFWLHWYIGRTCTPTTNISVSQVVICVSKDKSYRLGCVIVGHGLLGSLLYMIPILERQYWTWFALMMLYNGWYNIVLGCCINSWHANTLQEGVERIQLQWEGIPRRNS